MASFSAAHRPGAAHPAPRHSHVRKLIRSRRTRAFLTQDRAWTHDFHKAMCLSDRTEIEALRDQLQLEELEVYYSFSEDAESPYDFTLSLR